MIASVTLCFFWFKKRKVLVKHNRNIYWKFSMHTDFRFQFFFHYISIAVSNRIFVLLHIRLKFSLYSLKKYKTSFGKTVENYFYNLVIFNTYIYKHNYVKEKFSFKIRWDYFLLIFVNGLFDGKNIRSAKTSVKFHVAILLVQK